MSRSLVATLFLGAALLAAGLGAIPLLEPDEGRYADLARELVASRDLVVLRLNGASFHDKPPLVIWLAGLAFAALGPTETAARIVPAVFGWLGLALAAWLARAVSGRGRAGVLAALALGSSPLWLGVAKLLTLDAAFATLLAAAWGFLLRGAGAFGGDPSRAARVAGGALLGLATLAKGPVALVLVALAGIGFFAWERDCVRAFRLLGPLPWLVALAVAGPWFVAFGARNPEGLAAFLVEENLERFRDWHEHRHGPLFFAATALWGFSPAALLLGAAAGPARSRDAATRGLVSFVAAVFVFFTTGSSKIAPYILPAFPALAALAGRHLDRALSEPPRRRRVALAAILVAAVAGLAPLGWLAFSKLGARSEDPHVVLLAASAPASAALGLVASPLALGALVAAARGRRTAAAACALAGAGAALLAALPLLATIGAWKSARPAADLIGLRRRYGERVVTFMTHVRGLPFYLGEPVTLAISPGEVPRRALERERPDLWLADDRAFVAALGPGNAPLLVLVAPGPREDRFLAIAERAGITSANGRLLLLGAAGEDVLYEVLP